MAAQALPPVVLVCASQEKAEHFPRGTLLGRSLQGFPEPLRPRLLLLPANRGPEAKGLAEFYNQAIDRLDPQSILVFLHDDVHLHDWQLAFQLDQALRHFDLVGVVGGAGVPLGQPGWWHGLDEEGLPCRNPAVVGSGSINHFDPHQVRPDLYGPAPMACDLLDGVFLAMRGTTLQRTGLRFDSRFRFHCYDSDFCYSARALGLSLGTWPISLTHGSAGSFEQPWVEAARLLVEKLGVPS